MQCHVEIHNEQMKEHIERLQNKLLIKGFINIKESKNEIPTLNPIEDMFVAKRFGDMSAIFVQTTCMHELSFF